MSREQGDFLETPVIYTKTIDGQTVERPAYTAADHVNLQARGWRKQENAQAQQQPKAPAPAAPKAVEPNAGSAPV